MRRILIHIFLLLFFFNVFNTRAQEGPMSQNFETIVEAMAEDLEDEADYFSILEYLEEYYENPLNINSASPIELKRLSVLNEIQITNLLDYRKVHGLIYTIYELMNVEGFNREVLEKIAPFIKFEALEDGYSNKKLPLKYGKHQVLFRTTRVFQEAKGYKSIEGEDPKYEGGREKLYTRCRFQLKDQISAGITAEKDPGEAFFDGSNQNGFDYYSGHISMNFNSVLSNVTVGDYVVRSGQGLVLHQGFATGKSADVLNISKNVSGTRPYTSTDENLFFRGASAGFRLNDLDLQLFYSQKRKDANLGDIGWEDHDFFTSLQSSGYHRTNSEIEDEKSVQENAGGAILSFQKNRLKLGTTFFYQKFDRPFNLSDEPYNLYKFSGDENFNIGVDYRYLLGKYQFFGEVARSKSKGFAVLQGVLAHLHDRAIFSLLFRHFDKNYHALYSGAFSETRSTINETGLYMGLKLLPAKGFTFSAYTDIYKFPWIKYTTSGPSSGNEVFMQLEYRPTRDWLFYGRYKIEEKDVKFAYNQKYIQIKQRKQQTRLHVQHKLNDEVTLKSRVEVINFKDYESVNGLMFFQDLVYSPAKLPLKSYLRFVIFNTGSYDARVYAYENDLLYNYSVPAYYGKGIRAYMNLSYKVSPMIGLWLKLSNTHWTDRETISSGNNEIEGENLTEVKLQLRLKF